MSTESLSVCPPKEFSQSLGVPLRGLGQFSKLAVGTLVVLAGCGSPGELEEDLFPAEYVDSSGSASAIAGGPAMAPANLVSGGGGQGVAGASMMGMAGGANVDPGPVVMGCDAPALFQRPPGQGGCTGFTAGCHEGGGGSIPPDLVSPGVAERVLGATAALCGGRPLVGAGSSESVILLKVGLTGPSPESPECGGLMPAQAPELSQEDRLCISDWLDAIAGGG